MPLFGSPPTEPISCIIPTWISLAICAWVAISLSGPDHAVDGSIWQRLSFPLRVYVTFSRGTFVHQ